MSGNQLYAFIYLSHSRMAGGGWGVAFARKEEEER